MKLLGIYRHPQFSNNAIEADRLILEHAIERLRALSGPELEVEMAEESEVPHRHGTYDLILTMAQSADALRALETNFASSPVVNSVAAIRNCYRMNMSQRLSAVDVGYVPFRVMATDSPAPIFSPGDAFWFKRSDFHAICDDDVTLAESTQEAEAKLAAFRERGVREVIVQRHIVGDIYKFYGVQGRFFQPVRVRSVLNGGSAPDLAQLDRIATISAAALGLHVFGGDAILDSAGRFHLIDLNDWPSFRLCREGAATAIADLAHSFLPAARRTRALSASLT